MHRTTIFFVLSVCLFSVLLEIYGDSPAITLNPVTKLNETTLKDNKVYKWTSKDYPKPYPPVPEKQELVVKVEEPYSILVEIKELKLDGFSGDFLLIKSGLLPNDEGEGKRFTFFLKSSKKYRFQATSVYMGLHVLGDNERNMTGFSLSYQRVSNGDVTTTVAPTTSITWPTPADNDSIYFTAHVSGKTMTEFKSEEVLNNLKTSISNMAVDYCNVNNITLLQNITSQNVLIQYLNQCPYSWPNSDKCATVRFSLPIYQIEQPSWDGYQLKSDHMESMWLKFAKTYLAEYEMEVYAEPDNRTSFIKWLVIIGSIIFILLFMPILVDVVVKKFQSRNKNRNGDTEEIMPNEIGNSKLRSSKNPYQTTPQIFDNVTYEEYDFDIPLPKKNRLDYYEDNSDDEIVLSHFNPSKKTVDFSTPDGIDNWQLKKTT